MNTHSLVEFHHPGLTHMIMLRRYLLNTRRKFVMKTPVINRLCRRLAGDGAFWRVVDFAASYPNLANCPFITFRAIQSLSRLFMFCLNHRWNMANELYVRTRHGIYDWTFLRRPVGIVLVTYLLHKHSVLSKQLYVTMNLCRFVAHGKFRVGLHFGGDHQKRVIKLHGGANGALSETLNFVSL